MGHHDLSHLRSGRHRLTPQRRTIWEVLHSSRDHLTAEQIHMTARTRGLELTRPTVYRTLVGLIETNDVREIAVAQGPSRYEAICSDDPHSDLVCNSCGHIEKLPEAEFREVADAATRSRGFQAETVHVVVYATCDRCRTALKRPAAVA